MRKGLLNSFLQSDFDAAGFKVKNSLIESATLSNDLNAAGKKITTPVFQGASLFDDLDAAGKKIINPVLQGAVLQNDLDAAGHKIISPVLQSAVLQNDLDVAGFKLLNYTGGEQTGVFDVTKYGAKADAKTILDITMPNGNVVTSTGTTFVSGDIGKYVIIRGATDAGGTSPLHTTITAVNGNTATLAAGTTTALTNILGDSFARMDYGTNNVAAFNDALWALRNYGPGPLDDVGGIMYIPSGRYMAISTAATFWYCAGNIKVVGAGMGMTNIFYSSSAPITTSGNGLNAIGPAAHVTISDFTLTDLNYYFGVGNGINCFEMDDLTLERLELVNCKGNGCLNVQGGFSGGVPTTKRIRIRDNYIHGDRAGGYSVGFPNGIEGDGINAGQLNDVKVTGNTIVSPGRHAYEGGGNCYDQFIGYNNIDMKGQGYSGINPTGGNRTVVAYNNILNVGGAGYSVDFTTDIGTTWHCFDNMIVGNYVTTSGQAFRLQNTSNDVTVSHTDRIRILDNYVKVSGANSEYRSFLYVGGGEWMDIEIRGNYFNGGYTVISTVNATWTPIAGKYIVVEDNHFAPNVNTNAAAEILSVVGITESFARLLCFNNNRGGVKYALNQNGRIGHPVTTDFYGGPSTLASAGNYSFTFAFYGAVVDLDEVIVIPGPGSEAGLIFTGIVSSYGNVTVSIYNPTAGVLNIGTPTVVKLIRHIPALP